MSISTSRSPEAKTSVAMPSTIELAICSARPSASWPVADRPALPMWLRRLAQSLRDRLVVAHRAALRCVMRLVAVLFSAAAGSNFSSLAGRLYTIIRTGKSTKKKRCCRHGRRSASHGEGAMWVVFTYGTEQTYRRRTSDITIGGIVESAAHPVSASHFVLNGGRPRALRGKHVGSRGRRTTGYKDTPAELRCRDQGEFCIEIATDDLVTHRWTQCSRRAYDRRRWRCDRSVNAVRLESLPRLIPDRPSRSVRSIAMFRRSARRSTAPSI